MTHATDETEDKKETQEDTKAVSTEYLKELREFVEALERRVYR